MKSFCHVNAGEMVNKNLIKIMVGEFSNNSKYFNGGNSFASNLK